MAADFREKVSQALDELAAEKLPTILTEILSLERLQTGSCANCGENAQVRTPDYRGFAAALAAFDGIGKGKQKTPDEPVVDDEQVRQALLRVMADWNKEDLERAANL